MMICVVSAGGGSKRLFRKIRDKSSEFYPHINEIRKRGMAIMIVFVDIVGDSCCDVIAFGSCYCDCYYYVIYYLY